MLMDYVGWGPRRDLVADGVLLLQLHVPFVVHYFKFFGLPKSFSRLISSIFSYLLLGPLPGLLTTGLIGLCHSLDSYTFCSRCGHVLRLDLPREQSVMACGLYLLSSLLWPDIWL